MFSHPCKFTYCGLTIIMSNASRFDLDSRQLLSANSGSWFCEDCLRPLVNRWQCDIADLEAFNKNGRKLRDGTTVVLCLGTSAMSSVMAVSTTLGEQRGSPVVINGIVYIASYLPQDSFDFKDFESTSNPLLNGTINVDEDDTSDAEDYGTEKTRHGKTKRGNWKFWLQADTRKAINIVKNGWHPTPEPEYRIYPNSTEIIESLRSYENTDLHLDIETDSDLNITCLGYGFGFTSPIWVIPIIRYNYTTAYSSLGSIMRSLAYAMGRNTTVAHNGSCFDFFVIPFKYRLPIPLRLYDTMIAFHRMMPEVEKSLGHTISYCTNLPYHKDEGVFEPHNEQQESSLWQYNGKDVFGMREVKKAIDGFASKDEGLRRSIEQANKSIYPYLTAALQGIRYNVTELLKIVSTNDRMLMQYLRMLRIAIGEATYKSIQGKSTKGMPGSSKQCVKYFHDLLGYPVVGRSKKTKKPSLDEKNLLKLKQKYVNPVIDVTLAYRGVAKESGSLGFTPWGGIKKYGILSNQ